MSTDCMRMVKLPKDSVENRAKTAVILQLLHEVVHLINAVESPNDSCQTNSDKYLEDCCESDYPQNDNYSQQCPPSSDCSSAHICEPTQKSSHLKITITPSLSCPDGQDPQPTTIAVPMQMLPCNLYISPNMQCPPFCVMQAGQPADMNNMLASGKGNDECENPSSSEKCKESSNEECESTVECEPEGDADGNGNGDADDCEPEPECEATTETTGAECSQEEEADSCKENIYDECRRCTKEELEKFKCEQQQHMVNENGECMCCHCKNERKKACALAVCDDQPQQQTNLPCDLVSMVEIENKR